MYKFAIGGSAVLIGIAAPLTAMSQDRHFSSSGRVPTVCTVDANLQTVSKLQAGVNLLGRLVEICNNRDGYGLVLKHPSPAPE